MESPVVDHLQSLGAGKTRYQYDSPDGSVLESFQNPLVQPVLGNGFTSTIHIEVPEFTSLCPKTGQPDFATIVIDYTPRHKCVESKSLKLYLMGYRMFGEFHESCVNRICHDLVALLDPLELRVEGKFTPRGGIPFWPVAEYWASDLHEPPAESDEPTL